LELHIQGNKYSEGVYGGLSDGEAGVVNAQVNFASVMGKKGAHQAVMASYFHLERD